MLKIEVKDMVCEKCEASVRSVLNGVSGVTRVTVDRSRDLVEVEHDGEILVPELLAAIARAGFQAKLQS